MKRKKNSDMLDISFKRKWKQYGNLLWFCLPAIILALIFNYAPMAGLVMAFKENPKLVGVGGPIMKIIQADWVGLKWFKQMFTDANIIQAFKNTLEISVLRIVILFPIPIIMAICISEMTGKVIKKTIQAVMYIPHFLSWVTVGGIFITILAENTGMVNNVMAMLGYERVAFVTTNETFRFVVILSAAWKFLGWNSIVYVSAITAVDRNLIEAAKIDGATKFQQIWHVTLPGIMPTIAMMFILRIGGIMDAGFDQIFILYSPYIKKSGDILGTYTYRLIRDAGLLPQYALSTAVGLFNSVVAMILVILGDKVSKAVFKQGIW